MNQQQTITILIATGLYPPDIGGPATYSRMLEEKLCLQGIATRIVPFGTVRHLPKVLRHFVFTWRLFKESAHIDCIYALDPISVGIPAYLVSIVRRKPFLIRLGGDYAWEQGQQRFGLLQTLDEYTLAPRQAAFQVRFLASLQTFIVRKAKFVIAPSEYLKSIIASWKKVDASKIRVIYSALFPLQVEGDRKMIREQLSYTGTVITTVGRLVPWKGFSELIEVVASLKKEVPDISLVIIGDGPQEEILKEQITTLHMEDTVRLVGRLGKDALGAALKGSDLFVLNTSYEGLSHQLLEVMELGIPIVTTNVGGNPELIVDGISGVLVPIHDTHELQKTIVRVLQNKELQIRLVQNARVRIKDFNQDVVVNQLARLVSEEVIPKK